MSCLTDKLGSDINGCQTPLIGYKQTAWIGTKADNDTVTIGGTTGYEVTALSNGSNHAYTITTRSKNPFNTTKIEMVEKDYGSSFKNTVEFMMPGSTPAIAKQAQELVGQAVYVILEQLQGNDTDKNYFPVFGLQSLLRVTKAECTLDKGGWVITLEEDNCDKPALYLFNTNYATTQAIITALA